MTCLSDYTTNCIYLQHPTPPQDGDEWIACQISDLL